MMQKIELEGFVGREPELRYLPSGSAILNFSLGVSDDYKDKKSSEWVKRTIWIRVSTFGNRAEALNGLLKKGMKIKAVGKLSNYDDKGNPKIWTDKDGKPHANYEVIAFDIALPEGEGGGEVPTYKNDELPF